MYRIILIIVITLFVIRIIWIYRAGKWDFVLLKNLINQSFELLIKWLMLSEFKSNIFKRLRYFFISTTVIFFIILALTGIIPVVILGEQISGLFLIVHVTIAPFFVAALMLTAVFWAHFQQFNHSDFIYLRNLQNKKEVRNSGINQQKFWPKNYFWLFLVFSVPAVLSIILSMFPYFGTGGQITMLNIHRYSTLVLLIIALFYTDIKLYLFHKKVKEEQVEE